MARSVLKAEESNLLTQPGQWASDSFCFPLGDLQRALLVPVIGRRASPLGSCVWARAPASWWPFGKAMELEEQEPQFPLGSCVSTGSRKLVTIWEGYGTGSARTPVSPGSWVWGQAPASWWPFVKAIELEELEPHWPKGVTGAGRWGLEILWLTPLFCLLSVPCFLAMDIMWPEAADSCCHSLPAMTDCVPYKPWTLHSHCFFIAIKASRKIT